MLLKVLCLSLLAVTRAVDDKIRNSWLNIVRVLILSQTTRCSYDQPLTFDTAFRCSSGQCIDRKLACDGKQDCHDGSDETQIFCSNVACRGPKYRCKYGGCVDLNAECNGTVECFDGSDEDPNLCNATSLGYCVLPQHPDFGQWSIQGVQRLYSSRKYVENETMLRVDCNKDRILVGSKLILCEDGKWSTNIGQCSKVCPPRLSTKKMTVICIYKNKEMENCTEAVDSTLARFKCASFFELEQSPVHLCQDGAWNQTLPRCVPACGGSNVSKRHYPWQVAIYEYDKNQHILICSGSLISQRLILTAAHCVTNYSGKLYPKNNYVVVVGKHRREINDSRDKWAQFSELEAMFVSEGYKGGLQNYLGDIAILVTSKAFTLSRRVQPVCLDPGRDSHVLPGDYGYMVGWGFTNEDSNPAEVLREVRVPLVKKTDCEENLPDGYLRLLTPDKLCAGYLNKGIAVCRGDNGGGLVFERNGKFYVIGVSSLSPTSPTTDGCDSNQYGLYTNVAYHFNDFILPKLSEYET